MNTKIGSPLHIHVAAFLWRTRKRSGFVAIVLLLGTIGVLSEGRGSIIYWLALAPLGGVIWLLFHLIGRQVEKEEEEERRAEEERD